LYDPVSPVPNGVYVIPTLPPGPYQLTASAPGFGTQETQPFDLASGQTGSLNVTLMVAHQVTQVVVQSTPPLLQTTSESVGTALSARTMNAIPLLGRSFLNAMTLSPGVIPVQAAGSTQNHSPVSQNTMPSVFGQRQKDNDFLIDGVDNRDQSTLGVAIYPPPDAIQEMKIDSGVGSAVYGFGSGATVDIVTKSGTNAWHGDAWEFWRNNILDAKSYFQLSVGSYHYNQFGGSAGGPLVIPWLLPLKRKWYVFAYYEGVRIKSPDNFTTYVPTAAQVSGDFSAPGPTGVVVPIYDPFSTTCTAGVCTRQQFSGNKIPTNMLNPTAVILAQALFPAPNLAPGRIPGANFISNGGDIVQGDQWNIRADHQFGDHDSFFVRYTSASNPSSGVGLPNILGIDTDQLKNAEASDTHVFSKSLVLTMRFGFDGTNDFSGEIDPAGLAKSSGLASVFPPFLGAPIIPGTGITGYAGIPGDHNFVGPEYEYSGIVDAQKIAGEHTLEFGGHITHESLVAGNLTGTGINFLTTQTSDFNTATGDALASFLLGVPDNAARQEGGNEADLNGYAYGFYVQDTWRHKRLTLNGGVRYDYNAPPVNSYGLGTFDFDTGTYVWDQKNPITGAAATIRPGGIPPDRNNFAPRFGIAYQVTPRTVVRASAGVFYDSFGSNYMQAARSAAGNWPFGAPQSASGLNATTVDAQLPNPFPGSPLGSPIPTGCGQCLNVDKNSSRTPYVEEWTLSVQRQIGKNLTVEGDYFGSKGNKLTSQIVDNTAPTAGVTSFKTRQLYPQFSPYVNNGYNAYSSYYEGGALRVQRRYSSGLSFLLSYTYSKNIDYVDNLSSGGYLGQVTSNPTRFNGPLNRGLAGFDMRNVLSLSNVWNIPWRTRYRVVNEIVAGWSLSNILSYRSGMPYSVFLGNDNENIGTAGRSTEMPNIVGDPKAVHQSPEEWFNTAAFQIPALGTVGNMRRNPSSLKSGTATDDDLSVAKFFPLVEPVTLEIRGEAFNLANHANFAFPGQVVGTASFGKVSNTLNGGRIIQLVAKIHF
jgi:hypothetical protein